MMFRHMALSKGCDLARADMFLELNEVIGGMEGHDETYAGVYLWRD
jgi:hypothetical protein